MKVLFKHLLAFDDLNTKAPLKVDTKPLLEKAANICGIFNNEKEKQVVDEFIQGSNNAVYALMQTFDYTLSDIESLKPLRDEYNELKAIKDKDADLRLIACIAGKTEQDVFNMKIDAVNKLYVSIAAMYDSSKGDVQKTFVFNDKTYYLPQNINDPDFGVFHDVENYIQGNKGKGWYIALMLLACHAYEMDYDAKGKATPRPYNIDERKARFEAFKELPLEEVYAWLNFFLRKGRSLLKVSNMRLEVEKRVQPQVIEFLLGTDGQPHSTKLRAIYSTWTRLLILKLLKSCTSSIIKITRRKLTRRKKLAVRLKELWTKVRSIKNPNEKVTKALEKLPNEWQNDK